VADVAQNRLFGNPFASSSLISKVVDCLKAIRDASSPIPPVETELTPPSGVYYYAAPACVEPNLSIEELIVKKPPSECSNASVIEENDEDSWWYLVKQSPSKSGDTLKSQSQFMPAGLEDGHCFEDDPIPPEYNPELATETEVLPTDDCIVSTVDSQCQEIDIAFYREQLLGNTAGLQQATLSVKPLTQEWLIMHTFRIQKAEAYHKLAPQGPYPYMANPDHPEHLPYDENGFVLKCPDGCADCEVSPRETVKSKIYVDSWFEKNFTLHDMNASRWIDPQEQEHEWGACSVQSFDSMGYDDYEDEYTNGDGIDDEIDFLYGATDSDELLWLKLLQVTDDSARINPTDRATCHMMRAEIYVPWRFPYFHGRRYNVIVAEYEPRYLPTITFRYEDMKTYDKAHYPRRDGHDPNLPVWEARGAFEPGQGEEERMEQTRIEYRRQWAMYRVQDDARMRYIAAVREQAALGY
jgi:hypothetical protein